MDASHGHFICCAKINNQWWCLNDSDTLIVDEEYIKRL